MWNKLSMKEKAALIKVAVSNGLTDLDLIKNKYNEFAEGGSTKSSDEEYYSYMEKLATKKAKDWGEDPNITLTHMLNSNDYNYRVFYDNNKEKALAMLNADPEAHFTDIGKTVYHPTFSNESIYSGKKSDYNPRGTVGGSWNDLEYVPSKSQLENKDFNYNKTKKYLTNTPEYIDSRYNKFAEGGDTNNNRPEDQPQITWIENWLNNRKDILAKNISMTKHGNSVPVYTPINNTGDVRNSRFDMDYNSTIYNPLYFLLGENPRIKQAEKIISREMQNIRNVPVTNVGDEYHPTSGVLGAYVEPSIWDNSGNYIAYLGTPTDDVKIHEFTHASQPKPQEYYIEDIIFKNKDIPNSVPGKTKAKKSKEIYGALQQVRYKSGLLPNTIIDKKWLQENKKYIKNTYLEKISENDLLRLFNEVAQNSDNQLEIFNNPLEINNNFLALGGPLLNQNNPIESFNGGKRLPVVRYDTGGTLNENTNVNVTKDGNKVIYDFSQNEDVNNPGYLGNETYDLGVLPNIEVKASTNSASSNRAYRNWLQKQKQQEFNNYIREGTNKFAKPLQYGFLGAMTLPVASGALSGMSTADAYLASKVPYYTVGKSVLEGVGTAYDVGTRVNDIVTEGKYQPYVDFKEGNYGSAALGLGFDALNILGTVDLYNNVKRTINTPKIITAYHKTENPFDIDNFYTGTVSDYGLHAGDAENKGDVVYELTIPKPKAKVMDTWENNYRHLSTDYIIKGKEPYSYNWKYESPENKMSYFLEYFRNPKNWGKRFPKFEDATELTYPKMHFFDDFHFNLRRLLTKKLPYKDRKAFNLEADKLLEEAQKVGTKFDENFKYGIPKNLTPEQEILITQQKEINEKVSDLLYRYGFDVLEYNNINAAEGLKSSYIITNPKAILKSKRIKSEGGGIKVKLDEGGYAPSITSIEYHPEDFYELGDDVRFVGEKRVHNPEKSAETDAWYRENAPHYWTLMNKRDKSGFDLETKGVIKDIENTIYNSGFESYIPEIVVTAKRPQKTTSILENTTPQENLNPTINDDKPPITGIYGELFNTTEGPKWEETYQEGRIVNGFERIASEPVPITTVPEAMNIAENWARRVQNQYPDITPEQVRNALEDMTYVRAGYFTGDRGFSSTWGYYSPALNQVVASDREVTAHELEHALRDQVLGSAGAMSDYEKTLLNEAYPIINTSRRKENIERLAVNAEIREHIKNKYGWSDDEFNEYIDNPEKISDLILGGFISSASYMDDLYNNPYNPYYDVMPPEIEGIKLKGFQLSEFGHMYHLMQEGKNIEEYLDEYFDGSGIYDLLPGNSPTKQKLLKFDSDIKLKEEELTNKVKAEFYNEKGKLLKGKTERMYEDKLNKVLQEELYEGARKKYKNLYTNERGNAINEIKEILKKYKSEYRKVDKKHTESLKKVRKALKEIAKNNNTTDPFNFQLDMPLA